MKQTACALLAATLALLAACATPAPPESQPPPPSDSITEPIEEQNSPDPALSKAPIIGVFRQDVDFLTDEQWALYDKGLTNLCHFMYDPGYIDGDKNAAGFDAKIVDGWQYYPYYSEKYPNYDAFYQDMLTIYTPALFETLNHTMKPRLNEPAPSIYLDVEGNLYYLNCTGGANLTHLQSWDRYELVSKDENRIEFDVIAYYCEHDDVSLENPVPVRMKRGPIVMERTDADWRISKFDYPDYLEKTGGYDTDINPD